MVFFPLSFVLRWFTTSTYFKYASVINPCAAALNEKNPHF
jgi:hypothetical protein